MTTHQDPVTRDGARDGRSDRDVSALLAPQFPGLDTLRAVGALGVLITHTAFWAGSYTRNGTVGTLLARMDVGVAIFFVLSGFLLSRAWLARAQLGLPSPRLGSYAWKRVLRIMPVYLVVAVIALSLIPENSGRGFADWLVSLSLADIYVDLELPAGLTQMWSLATELAFYAALPLLMLLALGRRPRRLSPGRVGAVIVALMVLSPVWLLVLGERVPGAADRSVYEWLPSFGTWFGAGIALALLHVLHQSGRLGVRTRRAIDTAAQLPGVCWLVATALLLIAATPVAGPTVLIPSTQGELVAKNLLYLGIGAVIVFTGVFTPDTTRYQRILSLPALRHLGHLSYAVFCIHLPIQHLLLAVTGYELFAGHGLQIFFGTLVLSLLAAEVLHRLVELPSQRLRNLGRRSAAKPTAAPSATTTR